MVIVDSAPGCGCPRRSTARRVGAREIRAADPGSWATCTTTSEESCLYPTNPLECQEEQPQETPQLVRDDKYQKVRVTGPQETQGTNTASQISRAPQEGVVEGPAEKLLGRACSLR